MSVPKKYINTQIINSHLCGYGNNILKEIVKKTQNNIDPYEIKSKNDKLHCVVCGGKYIRSQKCIHLKTKKHQDKLEDIKDMINDCLIESIKNGTIICQGKQI
jgi:hypothetical protein